MNNLPYDVVKEIYSYLDCRNTHKETLQTVLLEMDREKRPWKEFRSYWAEQYHKHINGNIPFFCIYIFIWDWETGWRHATLCSVSYLFGGCLEDGAPAHSTVHVMPKGKHERFDWDNPEYLRETYWKPDECCLGSCALSLVPCSG